MVLVMIGALNVILLTLRQQDSVTQAVIEKSDSSLNKLNEQIKITDIRLTNSNKLNMTITNSGGVAAKLASLYLVNETASPKVQYRFDLDNLVIDGRESVSGIGSDRSVPIHVNNNARYTVKVVTTAGNSAVEQIVPLNESPLQMALFVIPPTITTGQNVTLLFSVTNNNTDSTLATTVSPTISPSLSCTPYPSATCKTTEKISAVNDVLIPKGSTYLFKWVYEVKGPIGTTMNFNASLVEAKQGNYVIEKGHIQPVSSAQVAETFLFARLIQQPEILPLFPSPWGTPATATATGLWGAVVANPSEQAMNVRKLVITTVSPRGQSNDKIIQSGAGCTGSSAPTAIQPASSAGTWSCPAINTLVWKPASTPLSIPAHSAQEFLVAVHEGSTSNGAGDIQSYLVNLNVFTDYGQFAKAGYDGAMRESSGPIASVYVSDTTGSITTSHMKAYLSVQQGATIKVNATIADLDSSASTQIDSGTKLVIDVPKDFSNVDVTSSTGFGSCDPQLFTDGSWQISCALTSALTGAAGSAAKTIQFTMDAPTVDQSKLYVLYILADGTADSGAFTVGPVAETVIQVTQ
jgi:hypothetical protein